MKKSYEYYEKIILRLGAEPINRDKSGFTRTYGLETISGYIRFEIFKNLVNVYIGDSDIQIVAYNITVDGCWPNRYKTSINLRDHDHNAVAVIPIEKYKQSPAESKGKL